MTLPPFIRSRTFIMALTASFLAIAAGKYVALELGVNMLLFWGLVLGKRVGQGLIDSYKGQYYDKEAGRIKKVADDD